MQEIINRSASSLEGPRHETENVLITPTSNQVEEEIKAGIESIADDINLLKTHSSLVREEFVEDFISHSSALDTLADDGDESIFRNRFAAGLLKRDFPNASQIILDRLADMMVARRKRILSQMSGEETRLCSLQDFAPDPEDLGISPSSSSAEASEKGLSSINPLNVDDLRSPESRVANNPGHSGIYPPVPKVYAGIEMVCPYCLLVLPTSESNAINIWRHESFQKWFVTCN